MKAERLSIRAGLLAALSLASGVAAADSWEVVVQDRDRQVEIDRSTIIQSDGGTKVAWGRIALSREEARSAGYATIKALNRYDCINRSFYTVKRVYLDERNIVLREESVVDQSPVPIVRHTVDERLWREVCRPPSVSDLRKVARDAGESAAAAQEGGEAGVSLRPADLRHTEPAPRAAQPEAPRRAPTPAASPMPAVRPSVPAAPAVAATPAAAASPAHAAPARKPAAQAATQADSAQPARRAGAMAAQAHRAASRPAASSPAPAILSEVRWSYEGNTGPEHWGRLRPDWALCAEGKHQSPIDLTDGIRVDLEPVRFDYRPTRFRITDTGNTLEVRVGEGLSAEIRGRRYELTEIRFHRPSEARVAGRAYDMAAHLHHRDAEGHVAIVAIMLERGETPHPLVQTLWNSLPLERGGAYMPAAPIDPASLLPASPAHYLYMGSLTTPPCTEGVLWAVMKEPIQLSDEQIRIFARLYPRNDRPVQASNGRVVLESR